MCGLIGGPFLEVMMACSLIITVDAVTLFEVIVQAEWWRKHRFAFKSNGMVHVRHCGRGAAST